MGTKPRVIEHPALGPRLSPVVRVAMERLAEKCSQHKGFASPVEKTWAIEILTVLTENREAYEPHEIETWAATHGWDARSARRLAEFAAGVAEGKRFRGYGGRVIHIAPHRAERMIKDWRNEANG
jgi:hypothetical protein